MLLVPANGANVDTDLSAHMSFGDLTGERMSLRGVGDPGSRGIVIGAGRLGRVIVFSS